MSDYESDEDVGSDYEDPELLGNHSIPLSNKKYFDDDENDQSDDDNDEVDEPLFKRLANLQKKSDERAFESTTSSVAKKRKFNRENDRTSKQIGTKESKAEIEMKKRTKHMPATMRSNKPVSRYILDVYILTFLDR